MSETTKPGRLEDAVARARNAAAAAARHDLAVLRIEDGRFGIEIRRRPTGTRVVAAPDAPVDAPHPSTNGSAAPAPEAAIVRAEIVGIVRLSRPSVSEGATVEPDRELAYVESLGIRNPVRSAVGGRVASIFIEDGQSVEYGQPLFAIETAHHDS